MRKSITIIDESKVRQFVRTNDQYQLTEIETDKYVKQPLTAGHSVIDLTHIPSNKYGLLQSLPGFSMDKSAGRPVWLGETVGPEIYAPLVKALGAEVSGLPDFKVPLCIFSNPQQERMNTVFDTELKETLFLTDGKYLDALVDFENEAKVKSQEFKGTEFDQRLFLDRAYGIGLLAVCCKANIDAEILTEEHARKFISDRLRVLDNAWQNRDAEVPTERLNKIRSMSGELAREMLKKTMPPRSNTHDLTTDN